MKKRKISKEFFAILIQKKEEKYGVVVAYMWATTFEDLFEII